MPRPREPARGGRWSHTTRDTVDAAFRSGCPAGCRRQSIPPPAILRATRCRRAAKCMSQTSGSCACRRACTAPRTGARPANRTGLSRTGAPALRDSWRNQQFASVLLPQLRSGSEPGACHLPIPKLWKECARERPAPQRGLELEDCGARRLPAEGARVRGQCRPSSASRGRPVRAARRGRSGPAG